ncbi:MAG: ATP-binding protein, partial [Gemmatimonadales bacterium]
RRGESVVEIIAERGSGRVAGERSLAPQRAVAPVKNATPARGAAAVNGGGPVNGSAPANGSTPANGSPPAVVAAAPATQQPALEAPLRVGQERVDELFGIANRLLIFAAQSETYPAIVEQMETSVTRASAAWRRLRRDSGTAAASNGSGSKQSARDFAALDDSTAFLRRESARLLAEMTRNGRDARRIAEEMSRGVRELRMRPFADTLVDLPRLARDVAVAAGKLVRVETSGGSLQADRVVLAQLREALMHLVRNAVDHGLERPEIRRAAGKPEEGTVLIEARLVGDRIVVTVADDGAGVDVAKVRQKLAARHEDVPDDDRAVVRRLFLGGISTRTEATKISGRGVGLDAVRAAADRVRGTVDVTWSPGHGTTFTIEAPLTLATARAVLARVGQAHVAIPAAFVERLMRVAPEELATVEGRQTIHTAHEPAVIASLAAVLGPPLVDRAPDGPLSFALVRAGASRVAFRVDALIEEIEVVVRPIRAHGQMAVPHISGAAMLPSGTIALVLNVTTAVAAALGLPVGTSYVPVRDAAPVVRRRVLVVDDSITTRTLEASVVEAAGYDVMTAVDGADAL